MTRFYYLLVFILLSTQAGWAQKTNQISGTVFSPDHSPLISCTIILTDQDGNTITYTITNDKGEFMLQLTDTIGSVRIAARHLSYGIFEKTIENHDQFLKIVLDPKPIKLDEINISEAEFSQSGDTLRYLLEAFANIHDRNLSDALKNIPGLEVSDNGLIRYNGTPINRFYVEGKDLMGGRYGVVTSALPNRDVHTIEILQNHQPIRALENKEFSPHTAINIKLKKNIALTGSGEIFTGFSPFLWQKEISPILFTKNTQALLSYKGNNTGKNLTDIFTDHIVSANQTDYIRMISTGIFIGTTHALPPPINQSRYFNNQTHTFTGNVLTGLGQDWEVKGSITPVFNNSKETASEHNTIYNETIIDPIYYTQDLNNEQIEKSIHGNVSLENNSAKKYIKNSLSFQYSRKEGNNFGTWNGNNTKEYINSPAFALQNALTATIPLGPGKNINVSSYFAKVNDRQRYQVYTETPLLFPDISLGPDDRRFFDFHQSIDLKNTQSEHQASIGLYYNKFGLIPSVGLKTEEKTLHTNLSRVDTTLQSTLPFIINKSHSRDITPYSKLRVNYSNSNFHLSGQFPIHLRILETTTNESTKKVNRFFFEPGFFVRYKFSSLFEWTGSFNIQQIAENNLFYSNYIMNALSFYRNPLNMDFQKRYATNNKLTFNKAESFLNIYVTHDYISVRHENILNRKILPNGQQITEHVPFRNFSQSQRYRLHANKLFGFYNSQLSINTGYGINNNNIIINESLESLKTNYIQTGLRLLTHPWNNLQITYSLNYARSWRNSLLTKQTIQESSHRTSIFYTISSQHNLGLSSDLATYDFGSNRSFNQFHDLIYRFAWNERRLDFEIKWSNITNNKIYNRHFFNDYLIQQSSFMLRPTEIVFGVRYNFSAFQH